MAPVYEFTAREAAEYLGLRINTLYHLAREQQIAHLQTGETGATFIRVVGGKRLAIKSRGKLRFSKLDLDAWLAKHRVEAHGVAAPSAPAATDAPSRSLEPFMPAVRRFS